MRRNFFALIALVLLRSLPASAEPPAEVLIVGPKGESRLSVADAASWRMVEVAFSDHGKPARFEGIELQSLLEKAGAPSGEHLRGKELTKYVIVEGGDGYRALFSLAELSSAFSGRKVILAVRRDGKPLAGEEGPFRVIVEDEKRPSRCVRQVATIRIADAK